MSYITTSGKLTSDRMDLTAKMVGFVSSLERNANGAVSSVKDTIGLTLILVMCTPILVLLFFYTRSIYKKIKAHPLTTSNYRKYRGVFDTLKENEESMDQLQGLRNSKGLAKFFYLIMIPVIRNMSKLYLLLKDSFESLDTPIADSFFTPRSGDEMWSNRNEKYQYFL